MSPENDDLWVPRPSESRGREGPRVYYHCTGNRGKCPEPYTREGILEAQFADLLKALAFDDEVLGWIGEALRNSHKDERLFHDNAISRLQAE